MLISKTILSCWASPKLFAFVKNDIHFILWSYCRTVSKNSLKMNDELILFVIVPGKVPNPRHTQSWGKFFTLVFKIKLKKGASSIWCIASVTNVHKFVLHREQQVVPLLFSSMYIQLHLCLPASIKGPSGLNVFLLCTLTY